jgi:hypothetical protein
MTQIPPRPPPAYDLIVNMRLADEPDGGEVKYVAAAPPDYRTSFSGSALPFTDAQHAFYNTPNRGTAQLNDDGELQIRLVTPNSYYVGMGSVRVPPTVHLTYRVNGESRTSSVQVSAGVPFRSLTYPKQRSSATFYAPEAKLVRSQESILRASAFPDENTEPDNFWGERPPR